MKILFNELKNYKISLFFILLGTYLSTTFELMVPLLLANIINVGIIENRGINHIEKIALMMLIFIILSILINLLTSYLVNRISIYSSANIRSHLYNKSLSLKNEEINKITTSSLLTRTNQDVDQIKGFLSSFINIIFKAPILFINCVTILLQLNKKFSLVLIISIIILLAYLLLVMIKLFPLSSKLQSTIDKLTLTIKEKIKGIKIIKSYNNLNDQDNKFKKYNKDYLTTTKQVIKISSFVMPILNLLINALIIIILLMSVNLVKNDAYEIGSIVATIQYILQILLSIIMLSMILILIPKTKISLNRIKEVLDSNTYKENEKVKLLDINNIKFNNVSFSYEENKILDNINFSINKKEKIGIIGLTGSGKSTIFNLLMKENENYDGNIQINDINLKELTRKDITSNITYLPSTPYILKGTILENIAFANSELKQDELMKILYTSNLLNFVNDKQEKLNYVLEENGKNLSGGQKQRISLARALAKKSEIFIMDEPFSSLDYNSEAQIINNLKTYYSNKTLVIISQKISSIKELDKIIVIDKGKIKAINNHENLLKTCNLYKKMYESQKEVLEYDI